MRYFAILFIFFLHCNDNKPPAASTESSGLLPDLTKQSSTGQQKKDSLLNIARTNYNQDSAYLDNIIWYGRRLAYLSRFDEAIDVYSTGLQTFPRSPELFRHRGHRYISTRQFDKAISDFEKAAFFVKGRQVEIEPDGIPNKLNQPLSTLQFNIWYHWGLAYYLQGDFSRAAKLYEACLEYSTNPDLLCATSDWLYMSYRRLGQLKKANAVLENISEDMEIIENTAYHKRLMMYKGLKKPKAVFDYESDLADNSLDLVTQGYGVGNYYLYNKDSVSARIIFTKLLESDYRSAFGYIAAEAEMNSLDRN